MVLIFGPGVFVCFHVRAGIALLGDGFDCDLFRTGLVLRKVNRRLLKVNRKSQKVTCTNGRKSTCCTTFPYEVLYICSII